jgi:hypothetical protein
MGFVISNSSSKTSGVFRDALTPHLNGFCCRGGSVCSKYSRMTSKGFKAELTQQSGIVWDSRTNRDDSFGSC